MFSVIAWLNVAPFGVVQSLEYQCPVLQPQDERNHGHIIDRAARSRPKDNAVADFPEGIGFGSDACDVAGKWFRYAAVDYFVILSIVASIVAIVVGGTRRRRPAQRHRRYETYTF